VKNKREFFRGRKHIRDIKLNELKHVFDSAFIDRERAEVVSTTGSNLLDVVQGEVLRTSRYIRVFTLNPIQMKSR